MYFVEVFHCNCSTGTVTRCLFLIQISQGGAVLFAPPRKAVAFLTAPSVCQKHGTGISLPAGSDQGYSPWTSPAFLKNCWIKKLFVCLRLVIGNIFLRKTTRIRFGKAGAHPQLAFGIAIAPETLSLITTFWFWRQLRFLRFSPRFLL